MAINNQKKENESLFENCKNHLDYWANHFSNIYKTFEKDELISEAWLRGVNVKNPKYLKDRIRFNMIDYIRSYSKSRVKKRKIIEQTNILEDDISCSNNKNIYDIDAKDLVEFLLSNCFIDNKKKEFIRLYYIEGNSYPEICEIMDTTQSTISSNLSSARKKLKNEIENMGINLN